jgi:hypothetical protein
MPTGGIANATGIHRHVDDLLFDLRRLPGVAIVQQKRASPSLPARSAAVTLFAFRRLAMADNISALAMGTMQDLDDHGFPSHAWVILFVREDSTSTALKHLHRTVPIHDQHRTTPTKLKVSGIRIFKYSKIQISSYQTSFSL